MFFNMLKNLITTFLLFLSFSLFAQKYVDTYDPDDEQIKSLLNKENDLNGFGGFDLKVGDLKGERGLLFGGYGGLVINRRYLFGVAGYGLVTEVEFDGMVPGSDTTKTLNLYGGYGGVLLGVSIAPKEVIHINIPIVLGAGSFEVEDSNFFGNRIAETDFVIENSIFFILEPGIEIEFNVSNHFRLGFGATYRYVTGLDLVNLSDNEVTGANGMISFRFGKF